jgi:hypothetical protein
MPAHGHTTAWGTHIGVGRPTEAKGWYAQLKTWWATHKTARVGARLVPLGASWDARHETVHALRADAAIDLVVPAHARSITTALCDLGS